MEVVRNLAGWWRNFLGDEAGWLIASRLEAVHRSSSARINPFQNALPGKLRLIIDSLAPGHYVRGNLFSFAEICLEFSYLFEHPLSNLNIELSTIMLWVKADVCVHMEETATASSGKYIYMGGLPMIFTCFKQLPLRYQWKAGFL